jgi:hypothetical protein
MIGTMEGKVHAVSILALDRGEHMPSFTSCITLGHGWETFLGAHAQTVSTYYYCYCKNYYQERENKIVESILRKPV